MHSRLINRSCVCVLFLGALYSTGCGSIDDEEGMIQSDLYAASGNIWPTRQIAVCWEDTQGYAEEREWVRTALESNWQLVSGVQFIGWSRCARGSRGVRIIVEDTEAAPHTHGLGRILDGVSGGVSLNFNFSKWTTSCRKSRESCIKSIAVHEFGHVLGFAHEQNRKDTPSSCKEKPQGPDGDTTVGAWDLSSIMNYCNPRWNNAGRLSNTDVTGAQRFYGDHERTDFPPQYANSHLEASYFPNPNGRLYAITSIGVRMKNGNIVTMRIGRREVLANRQLGPEERLRFGSDPAGGLEREVVLPPGWVTTGFMVRGKDDNITHLGLRARFLSSSGLGSEQIVPAGCCSHIEANATVSSGFILTGVGFRAHEDDVRWYGLSQRRP